MLNGLMQDRPLLISSMIRYAAEYHGEREIVARSCEGPVVRSTYTDVERRARQLALALASLGVGVGDRVGTLAWNTIRHYECYFGVSGMGAVLHTVNPRLFEGQIEYIINHAQDKVLLIDLDFLPIIETLAPRLPSVSTVVLLCSEADVPATQLTNVVSYETLLDQFDADTYTWPDLDERAASSLCYTSGTTGNPKGVLYSHRSTVIHALAANQPDVFGIRSSDSVLAIVPLYHANAWSLPYVVAMTGAKFVMPGPKNDPENCQALIESEAVTFSCAVPTVWTMMVDYLKTTGKDLKTLNRTLIGGTAVPKVIRDTYADDYGVEVIQIWGMTETSPLGTIATPTVRVAALDPEPREEQLLKQGRLPYGVEMKIVDDAGELIAKDGVAFGDIWVKGPWIASGYYRGEGGAKLDNDGWFPTGDVGTWDDFGYMKITDRTKDVIKSGGEWISSIEIENIAMSHPQVQLAATIAAYHPKWDERPLLAIVPADPNAPPTAAEILAFLDGKIAKWWLPDDVITIAEMPMTATGKILKSALRDDYWEHLHKASSDG